MSLRDPRLAMVGVLIVATVACLLALVPHPPPPTTGTAVSAVPPPSAASPASTTVTPLAVRAFAGEPVANAPSSPTAHDGQAKVWQQDGRWWAALVVPSRGSYDVFELDADSQSWTDTGAVIDDRPNVHPDAVVSGGKLYTVSAGSARTAAARPQVRRFSYAPTSGWSLDQGFPVDVATAGVISPSVARDSRGRVWVAFVDQGRVMVNASGKDEATWGAAWPMPGPGTAVENEDVARVIAVASGHVGVMWSNQKDATFRYAVHADSADPRAGWSFETPLAGPGIADNHIDLATADIDGAPHVLAVVKTSRDIAPDARRDDPEIVLLSRDPAGTWRQALVGRVRDGQTRPLILVDEGRGLVVVVTTTTGGGSASSITYQTARLDTLTFAPGSNEKLIGDEDDVVIDASGTHQLVDLGAGAVILAWDQARSRYEHAILSTRS